MISITQHEFFYNSHVYIFFLLQVTQNTENAVVQPIRNYMALSILAMFLFLPTGIVAVLKANEVSNEISMKKIIY